MMLKAVGRWIRRPAFWMSALFVASLVLAAACADLTAPRITDETDDTVGDTSQAG